MKKYAYKIGFCLAALLGLLCLVLCVATVFTGNVKGLLVREPITVSASPLDATHTQYSVQVRGILLNESGDKMVVDAVRLTLRDGGRIELKELAGFDVGVRSVRELFYEWESSVPFDRVDAVELVIGGEAQRLSNSTPSVFSLDTLLFFTSCAILAFLAVFFAQKDYYAFCEKRLAATREGEGKMKSADGR